MVCGREPRPSRSGDGGLANHVMAARHPRCPSVRRRVLGRRRRPSAGVDAQRHVAIPRLVEWLRDRGRSGVAARHRSMSSMERPGVRALRCAARPHRPQRLDLPVAGTARVETRVTRGRLANGAVPAGEDDHVGAVLDFTPDDLAEGEREVRAHPSAFSTAGTRCGGSSLPLCTCARLLA